MLIIVETVQGKIWIEMNSKCVLGTGRAEILRKIKTYGSLTKVAQSMNMAYSHAWSEIKEMEEAAGEPVIETVRGGKNGGSSQLTPIGEQLLQRFDQEQQKLNHFLSKRNKEK